jgi:hypothetical protein
MVKIILAALSGTVVYFLAGWLVFEGLLGTYMNANTTQIPGFKKSAEESSMAMLLVSCAAYALLLALVFGHWTTVRTFWEGAKLGALIGMLFAVMTNSYWFSTTHFFNGPAPLLVDVVAAGVTVGLMGGVVARVLA